MAEKTRFQETAQITELDQYLFGKGTHYELYKKLGAHPGKCGRRKGVYFAVWAPHAAKVCVTGSFCDWDPEKYEMNRLEPMGIYELFVPDAKSLDSYKYVITTKDGKRIYKADPFANYAEVRPETASRVFDLSNMKWTDAVWMKNRAQQDWNCRPISIYEVHPGSWMKHPQTPDGEPERFYNYREFAERAAEYMKEMGYTHIELIGIAEHPLDASWGYQVTGYYAPTARYGTPDDFRYMVNYFHRCGIGVILDWVPAHFPKDEYGLSLFDGEPLYEYSDPRKGEHPEWGTKVFDFGKNEVRNFLIANALYWTELFHVDGLRVDAVASMLYLDYGREAGKWIPNIYGGNHNLEAEELFRHLNSVVRGRNPGVLMIAEESTAWPMVTADPKDGGLGFSLKWNMGWMHDFLDYMKLDPYFRKYHHNKMSFSMTYAFSEHYCLVLSHDEVVHLKQSMICKMPGNNEHKFANLRAGYTYMIGHPGKKLLFMGQDFGQYHEWDEAHELHWFLLAKEEHRQLKEYAAALLHLYKGNPALYDQDDRWEGFEWINVDDCDRSIFSFIRHSGDGQNNLLFVVNFTPIPRDDYMVGVPQAGSYSLVLNSDEARFGGTGQPVRKQYRAAKGECDGRPYHLKYALPPFGAAVFRYRTKTEKKEI